jgi:hypothetical protein
MAPIINAKISNVIIFFIGNCLFVTKKAQLRTTKPYVVRNKIASDIGIRAKNGPIIIIKKTINDRKLFIEIALSKAV